MEFEYYKETPVYWHNRDYAQKNNEISQYETSYTANRACKLAIEKTLNDSYNNENSHLNLPMVLKTLTANFSMDRISYVLAVTVQYKNHDGRISEENKQWAKSIPVFQNIDGWGNDYNRYLIVDQTHPGLVDLFVTYFRKELATQNTN